MAFPKFDPAKHHRGLLGRFASSGEGPAVQRFRRGKVARVRLERQYDGEDSALGRRGAAAFQPPRPEGVARARHRDITTRARGVHAAYAALAGGTATRQQKDLAQYASPVAIRKARAETGSIIRPKGETMRIETHLARSGRTPRKNTKRGFAGRAIAVRGYGREYTTAGGSVKTSQHVRNLAGKRR